jgi:hypothetical protein
MQSQYNISEPPQAAGYQTPLRMNLSVDQRLKPLKFPRVFQIRRVGIFLHKTGGCPHFWQAPLQSGTEFVPRRTYGPRSAPAQIRYDLQRFDIKSDDIMNFLSNDSPIEQRTA